MAAKVADVFSILAELERTEREAESLVEGLTDEQINFQPDEGRSWSIAQCLDHLARMNTTYVAAMKAALDSATVEGTADLRIHPGWPSRFFIRSMDAPARKKFRHPKVGTPGQFTTGAEAVREFIASHDAVRALVREGTKRDLNRVRFKNPFVPLIRFTVGTGILVILAHDRRHLWQAGEVRKVVGSRG